MPQGRGYPGSGTGHVMPSSPGKRKSGQPDAAGPKAPKSMKGQPPTKAVTRAISRTNVGGTYGVSSADE